MRVTKAITIFLTIALLSAPFLCRGDDRPVDGITDNSFLIEEAHNQEEGVIQHIFTALYTNNSRHRGWSFTFTQEWPVFSEDHQFSFTIPSFYLREEGRRQNGIGDVLLNYRYQAFKEEENVPAFSPRFSLLLPTGNREKRTGNGVVGYQWNLPFSKKVASRLALHANLGLTYVPEARVPLELPASPLSRKHSLVSYNVGASAIYALSSRVNVLVEWLGLSEEGFNGQGKTIRQFKSTLSPGIRSSVIDKEEFQSVIGVALPVGLNRGAENFGVFLYLSIEHKIF
jgi:hypothetical protein